MPLPKGCSLTSLVHELTAARHERRLLNLRFKLAQLKFIFDVFSQCKGGVLSVHN